jgi:WD40 repeat protein
MTTAPGDKSAPKRPDVFISYSRKDREFVKRLDEALQARGREAWVDWEGIRPAEEFMQAIFPAIEGTDTFVFVISPDSVTSDVCGKELAHAATHNKRMVPIIAREVDAKAVPEPLAKLNWVFFCRENDSFDVGTEALISALDTDLGWVRAHTRLLTRAIEWEAKSKSNSFVLRGEDLRAAEQWLAQAGTEKERQPTRLQTEYIIASRKASARRQRITLGAVTFGLVIALVLAIATWTQRTKAINNARAADESANTAKLTSVQADFDLAVIYRRGADVVDPRTLSHLARALRTLPDAPLPRQYLISLFRDCAWNIARTEPLRHEGPVRVAVFSPDGTRLVTASDDKTARLWDASTGLAMGEPMRHGDKVLAAGFSADGTLVVTGSADGTARIWNANTGKATGAPMRRGEEVVSVSFSAGSESVLLKGFGSAQIWDAKTSKPLSELVRLTSRLDGTVSLSSDGTLLLCVATGGTVRIFDARTGQPIGQALPAHEVRAASFSRDGARIATVSNDKTARIWDASSGEPVTEPMPHETGIGLVKFSADGRHIVTGSDLGMARIWDAQTGAPVGEPMRNSGSVQTASFSSDGTRVLIHSLGGHAQIWDAKTGRPVGNDLRHDVDSHEPIFSPDGKRVLTLSSTDHAARMWNATTGKALGEPLRHEAAVRAASFSANGDQIVTASLDGTARIWNTKTEPALPLQLRHDEGETAEESGEITKFSPDGTRLLTAAGETLRFWDARAGQPLGERMRHDGLVMTADFSADGTRILTGSHDKTARFWDVKSGGSLGEPLRHEAEIMSAHFSPDGTRIATASMDGTARIWDAQTRKMLGQPIQPGTDWVLSARFSPDGSHIVTVSEKTAQLWKTDTHQPVGEPMVSAANIHDAIFNTDGTRILTLGSGQARLWDALSGQPVGEPLEGMAQDAGFSVDGTRVIAASAEHKALIWDAQDGRLLLEPSRPVAQTAGFSPEGLRIVTDSVGREEARLWDAKTGQPLSEVFRYEVQILSASFNGDGTRVVTVSNDGLTEIWDVAVDLETPLPEWVPRLAEALGGQRLGEEGLVVRPEKDIFALRQELLALEGDDFWSRLGRWFFLRGPDRTISPDSKLTVREMD